MHSQLVILIRDKVIARIEEHDDYYMLHDFDDPMASSTEIKKELTKLAQKGNKEEGAYDISKLSLRDRKNLVLAKVAARERANRTEIITDTNLPPRKAYLRLNALVSQGDLEAIGEKKGRIYKITKQGVSRLETLQDKPKGE